MIRLPNSPTYIDRCIDRFKASICAPTWGLKPAEWQRFKLGTFRLDLIAGFDHLIQLDPNLVEPYELEDPRRYPEFATYVRWAREGHEAPPVTVHWHADTGAYRSINRRRVLAARDAGVTWIWAWTSPVFPDDLFPWSLPSRRAGDLEPGTIFWTVGGHRHIAPDPTVHPIEQVRVLRPDPWARDIPCVEV